METSHNKRLNEMAVGVETCSFLLHSFSVMVWVMTHPIRHFAKPPGVKRKFRCAPFPLNGRPLRGQQAPSRSAELRLTARLAQSRPPGCCAPDRTTAPSGPPLYEMKI